MTTGTLDTVRRQLAAKEPELRRRGVRHLAVFGSVARGEDRADSDVDLAVEIEGGRSFSLIRMEETRLLLEDALGEIDSFRPPLRAAFERVDHEPIPRRAMPWLLHPACPEPSTHKRGQREDGRLIRS
jgi:predicted nucleotidyltransferase